MTQYRNYQLEEIEKALAGLAEGTPLRAIVAGPEVQRELADYAAADEHALKEQASYRFWGRLRLLATTLGVVVGAVLLLPLEIFVPGDARVGLGKVLGHLKSVFPSIAFIAIVLAHWLKPLEEWMKSRADAEQLRGSIFETIMNAAPDRVSPAALATDKLELLMKAHINDQLGFFKKRMVQHQAAASSFSPIRLFSYALYFIASVLGAVVAAYAMGMPFPETLRQFANAVPEPEVNRWHLGLSTMASGLFAHAMQRTLMEDDQRKASLYRLTADKLDALIAQDLAGVQAACARGEEAALHKFFGDARAILEQEHMVWASVLAMNRKRKPAR